MNKDYEGMVAVQAEAESGVEAESSAELSEQNEQHDENEQIKIFRQHADLQDAGESEVMVKTGDALKDFKLLMDGYIRALNSITFNE